MKKIRRTVSVVLAIIMAMAFNCTAFAAEVDGNEVSTIVNVETLEATDTEIVPFSTYLFNEGAVFNTHYGGDVFYNSSKRTVTFMVGTRGINTTNTVWFTLTNSSGTKIYATLTFDTVSTSSSKVLYKTVELPAGNYMVAGDSYGGTYSCNVRVYY